MRLISVTAGLTVCLSACTVAPVGPEGAAQVNPVIEQRIETVRLEQQSRGTPAFTRVPSDPPEPVSAATIVSGIEEVDQSATALKRSIAEERAAIDAEGDLAAAANALTARVAADREAARREGSLADVYPKRARKRQ